MAEPAPVRESQAESRSWISACLWALGLALALFLFYFAAYPLWHFRAPKGFDPGWYIWRAQYIGSEGLGPPVTATRPGYALLAAVLGSIAGRSQIELTFILPLALVSLLGLAVASLYWTGIGRDRSAWVGVLIATGLVVGPTHLVGENLGTLLTVSLVAGGLAFLVRSVAGYGGATAAVALMVAAGLAHWDFLGIVGLVLLVTLLWALREQVRRGERSTPLLKTEAGIVATIGAGSAATVAFAVAGILHAPFVTIEFTPPENVSFVKFLDSSSLLPVAAAALFVASIVRATAGGSISAEAREVGVTLRMLKAWGWVTAAGTLYGLVTLDVPPARFLALLVAVPGGIAVGIGVVSVAQWSRTAARSARGSLIGAIAGLGVVMFALALLTLLAGERWYGYGAVLDPQAMREAQVAGRYVESLPAHRPVIFVADFYPNSLIGAQLQERTIRIGLPPDRKLDAYLFVGSVEDLLAGRRTDPPDELADRYTRPYWEDVQGVLPQDPPVIVLRTLGGEQFTEAVRLGARLAGSGVAVVRGPAPTGWISAPLPPPAPSLTLGVWWGFIILIVLSVAGAGWTLAIIRPDGDRSPELVAGLAPVVGAGVLMLGSLVAAKVGVRLEGLGGVLTGGAVAVSGIIITISRTRIEKRKA